jgi:tetratricopeptide (TPR) repeat protein
VREGQIAAIRRFIEVLNSGLDEAEALSSDMLALPPDRWDGWLVEHPSALTVPLFNALLKEAAHSDEPLSLTEFATRHVDAVGVPPEAELQLVYLKHRTWNAHARALRSAGRIVDALRAYETATAIARGAGVLYAEAEETEREAAIVRAARDLAVPTEPAGIASRLLAGTPPADWPKLADREDLRNEQVVDELIQEIVSRTDRVPAEALAAADLAVSLAEAIPFNAEEPLAGARARARALRYRSQSLRALARYRESLEELDRADELLAPLDALGYERALAQFSRAVTLQEAGRYDEASAALAKSRTSIDLHGEPRMQLLHRLAEGSLLYRTGQLAEAQATWTEVLAAALASGDVQAAASVHNNLAYVLLDLGEFAAADEHGSEAIRLFTELGQPIHVLRSQLARGRILIKQGSAKQGITQLRDVRERFLEQGLVEEAGLCGLEIVEAQLAGGAAAQAEALARRIVRDFTAAQLNRRAIIALGVLSDAIAARQASAATAENVRVFIHTLRHNPDAEFRAIA